MNHNLLTCPTVLLINSFGMLIALVIMLCIPTTYAQVIIPENTSSISIVPGASSPSNTEFFKPNWTEVPVDTNVTWTNNDSTIHTVNSGIFNTADLGEDPFQSGVINQGGTFKHLFKKPGTFTYFCSIHPFMEGKIIVR
jgi:plastocyanin